MIIIFYKIKYTQQQKSTEVEINSKNRTTKI